MPDATSPFDDPFADLFGKLPDPRERRIAGEHGAHGAAQPDDPSRPEDTTRPEEPERSTEPGHAPLSRREARAAAARTPPARPARKAEPGEPQPARAVPASAVAAAATPVSALPVNEHGAAAPGEAIDERAASSSPYSRGERTTTVRPAATATLEDLFTGAETAESLGDVPPPKNRRRRRIGGWIALGVVLVLLGGVAGGGLWVWNTYEDKIREVMGWEEPKDFEAGMAGDEVLVTVSPGDTGGPISQMLFDAGVTKTPDAFYDHLIDSGQNPPFVPGVFRLQLQMTSEAALEALLDPANKLENTAQLREGLTVEQSLPILADGTGLPLEDFQAAVADPAVYGVTASTLEGWLFPATYTFDPGMTAADVIGRLVERAIQSLDAAAVPVEDRQRILTIASIIQREARFEADFYKVSRVIQNRLDPGNQETFGLLQMDSTAQYGYGELHDGTVSSSGEALADDNPWNTYVYPGLPVGPIANPGDTAIDAAMHPADGDWLYFVTVNLDTGETLFTSNLADHNRGVAQWQAWCRENPDSGC